MWPTSSDGHTNLSQDAGGGCHWLAHLRPFNLRSNKLATLPLIAGFIEIALRERNVVLLRFDAVRNPVFHQGRQRSAARRHTGAPEHDLDNLFLGHRVVERMAERPVIEGRLPDV